MFTAFLKIGCIAFGGGYAILPILERELIEKRRWTTLEEVIHYYTIAQITPGIIAVNVSTFIGYKRGGVAGGILATLGFVLPSATMVVIIAAVLQNVVELPAVQHCLNGIRIAVGVLLINTVFRLVKQLLRKNAPFKANLFAFAVFTASFLALLILKANPIFVVAAAGAAGFLCTGPKEKQ